MVLNIVQAFQYGGRPLSTVGAVPLEVPDPQGHARQFRRKPFHLDTEHPPGVHQRW